MSRAHTPGPWLAAARPTSIVGWPVVAPAAQGRSICSVTYVPGQADAITQAFAAGCAANARLIAASPELLDALEGLVKVVGSQAGLTTRERAKLEAGRAAIAKATTAP